MVQLLKRELRTRTDVHIPLTLIGFLKAQAKEKMYTSDKVEIKIPRGVIKIEPLWLQFNEPIQIAEQLHVYLSQSEITVLEKEIIEAQELIKEITLALVKNGSPAEVDTILNDVKAGKLDIEQLRAKVEELAPKQIETNSDKEA